MHYERRDFPVESPDTKEFRVWWISQEFPQEPWDRQTGATIALCAWRAAQSQCQERLLEETQRKNAALEEVQVLMKALKYANVENLKKQNAFMQDLAIMLNQGVPE